jgi:hypothetical protein
LPWFVKYSNEPYQTYLTSNKVTSVPSICNPSHLLPLLPFGEGFPATYKPPERVPIIPTGFGASVCHGSGDTGYFSKYHPVNDGAGEISDVEYKDLESFNDPHPLDMKGRMTV